jgi:hypothetical protein
VCDRGAGQRWRDWQDRRAGLSRQFWDVLIYRLVRKNSAAWQRLPSLVTTWPVRVRRGFYDINLIHKKTGVNIDSGWFI